MKELITAASVQRILQVIALVTPCAGVVLGAIIGCRRKCILTGVVVGVLWGIWGTAVFGLWRTYIAFGKHFGYTSVNSLAVQLVIFLGLGVLAGIIIQRAVSAPARQEPIRASVSSDQEEIVNVSEGLL